MIHDSLTAFGGRRQFPLILINLRLSTCGVERSGGRGDIIISSAAAEASRTAAADRVEKKRTNQAIAVRGSEPGQPCLEFVSGLRLRMCNQLADCESPECVVGMAKLI